MICLPVCALLAAIFRFFPKLHSNPECSAVVFTSLQIVGTSTSQSVDLHVTLRLYMHRQVVISTADAWHRLLRMYTAMSWLTSLLLSTLAGGVLDEVLDRYISTKTFWDSVGTWYDVSIILRQAIYHAYVCAYVSLMLLRDERVDVQP